MFSGATTSQLSPSSIRSVSTRLSPRSAVMGVNSTWSKSCLRPHSPLRFRQTGGASAYSSMPGSPNLSSRVGLSEIASSVNEGGSTPNRTLKRFMTMKKSKATELLRRGDHPSAVRGKFTRCSSIFSLVVEASEGDALLLAVIEAYCIANTTTGTLISQTTNSFQPAADPTHIPLVPPSRSSANHLDA